MDQCHRALVVVDGTTLPCNRIVGQGAVVDRHCALLIVESAAMTIPVVRQGAVGNRDDPLLVENATAIVRPTLGNGQAIKRNIVASRHPEDTRDRDADEITGARERDGYNAANRQVLANGDFAVQGDGAATQAVRKADQPIGTDARIGGAQRPWSTVAIVGHNGGIVATARALNGKGVGVLIAVIIGQRDSRCAGANGRWGKGNLESGGTVCAYAAGWCAGKREVTRIGAAERGRAEREHTIATILHRKRAHHRPTVDRHTAEISMIAAAGRAIATGDGGTVALHRDFRGEGCVAQDRDAATTAIARGQVQLAISIQVANR